MTPPHVTAVIVTYHTGEPLRECLAALARESDVDSILVVDNGNPAEMREWLRDFSRGNETVRLITPERNLGFGAAIDLAAGYAEEGYLLLVNPDAVIEAGAPSALVTAMTSLRQPRVAGGQIHDSAGQECRGGRRRKLTLFRALTSFCGWNTWTLEATPAPDAPVAMDAVSGAFMLTDTASFKQLGGFDEAYFMHVEDIDLCRRAWEAGGEVVYVHTARALHYGATSDVSGKTVAGYKADSLSHYFQKFSAGPVQRHLIRWLIALLLRQVLLLRARD